MLTSSWVKLWTGPLTEIFSTRPLLLSCSLPAGGSLVSTYRSFRLSESISVPFRFCSVILEDDPEIIQSNQHLYLRGVKINSALHLLLAPTRSLWKVLFLCIQHIFKAFKTFLTFLNVLRPFINTRRYRSSSFFSHLSLIEHCHVWPHFLPLTSPLTCRELQTSVDGHSRPLALCDVHGELQAVHVREDAIGDCEPHLVSTPADRFRCVDQQLVQDVLVGEGRALRKDPAILQRLRVELPSAEFAWGDERLTNLWFWSGYRWQYVRTC